MKSALTAKRLAALLGLLAGCVLLLASLPYAWEMMLVQAGRHLLGLQLEVTDLSGNILHHLTIGRLTGVRRQGSAQPLAGFSAACVQLDYSLPALLRGGAAFFSELKITAGSANLVVEPFEGKTTGAAAGGVAAGWPVVLPDLAVQDLRLAVHASGYELALNHARLQVGPAGEGRSGQPVEVSTGALELKSGGKPRFTTSCRAALVYTADQLRLTELRLADQPVSLEGELMWPHAGAPARFDLQAEIHGGRLTGSGLFAASQTSLALELADLDLATLGRLLHFTDFPVAGKISGRLTSRFDPASAAGLAADLELTVAAGELAGKKGDGRLAGSIRDNTLTVAQLTANYGSDRLEMAGAEAPLALFTDRDPARLAELAIRSFSLELRDIPGLLVSAGLKAPLPSVPDHRLFAQGSMANRTLGINQADFKSGKNSATLTAGRLQFAATGKPLADSAMAGRLRFNLSDLQEVAQLFALPAMAGEARGEAEISGTLRKPAGHLALAGKNLVYNRCGLGDAALEVKADTGQLRLLSLELHNEADRLQASGSYSLTRSRLEQISGRLSVKDLARYAGACPLLPGRLQASGIEAEIATTPAGEQRMQLTMNQARLADLPRVAQLQLDLTTDWRDFTITAATVKTGQGQFDFSGHAMRQQDKKAVAMQLDTLSVTREGALFSLERPASAVFTFGAGPALSLDGLILRSGKATLALQGLLTRDGESSFRISGANLASRDWLAALIGPQYHFNGADFTLMLTGPLTAPHASLSATVAALGCPQLTMPLSGDFALDYDRGAGLTIHKALFTTAHGQSLTLAGTLPYDPLATEPFLPGPIGLQGSLALSDLQGMLVHAPLTEIASGRFTGAFVLHGSWAQPIGSLRIKGADLFLSQFFQNAPHEPLTLDGEILLQPDALLLRTFTVTAPSLSLTMQGKWAGVPQVARLIRLPRRSELPGTVEMAGQLEMKEVGWLAAYTEGMRRLAGQLQAQVAIHGPAARPELSGGLSLTRGSIRLSDPNLPPLERLELQASIENNILRLQKCEGIFGGAPVQAAGTVFLAATGSPMVNCRLQGKDLLLYRDESLKVRADTDLTLQGPWRRLELGGKVTIVDGRYKRNVDFISLFRASARPKNDLEMRLFSLLERPWRDMAFDVRITPAEPFPVASKMARGAVRPSLQLTGTGESPVLSGRLLVDPTRIAAPAGTVIVDSGVITLPGNEGEQPTFDLSAHSRLAGYDITLLFQGTGTEPTITLSSDPPLADDELLQLVLTGRTPLSSQEKGKRALATMNKEMYLSNGLLSKWFGGDISEGGESMLDRFEYDYGRQLSKSGEETVEAQFRMVDGLLLPGDRLYLTSEKDVYDNYNAGVKIVFRFR